MIKKLTVIAVTAGFIAFTSCRTDSLTPEQDGRDLATELCDCFNRTEGDLTARLACFTDFQTNANRWTGADREALQAAFDEAIQNCETSPFNWYFTHQAGIAVAEFCALAVLHPDGADMLTLAPLYMRWETLLNSGNPAFLNPFFAGLMGCLPYSAWILCIFGISEHCPPMTDEELIELAEEATPYFCQFFTDNQGITDSEVGMGLLLASPSIARFAPHFAHPIFVSTLLQGLMTTCDATPMWFICMMTGGQAPGC